jgi:hypothetical protein
MWVATTDFPTAASHPFYTRLNQLLCQHGFDDFAEAQCATFYADTMDRPSLPPDHSTMSRTRRLIDLDADSDSKRVSVSRLTPANGSRAERPRGEDGIQQDQRHRE